ncbi:MAG TPA: ScpA family protein [Aliidongia sp.]|uniref:segregation and condensation protein A n=1 Tax=Aliidongia sp. TaxID=1914230 RepID=UPI002DDD7A7E|nr:ScpA family protein [Aliidongia sp.]HEV2678131.1 ScpA family protein [Aliidongia sp.]
MTSEDAASNAELVVDLDGFEGPIGMLLMLAREQKVDLTRISILALAEQYLTFIAEAHRLRLELAADYLVMAAWLAYLKSRMLLPDPPPDDEPTVAELAEALHFRLLRLEAMQQAGKALVDRPLLGRDIFAHGAPEGLKTITRPVYAVSLYELLKSYGDHRSRGETTVLHIRAPEYYSVDDAIRRLSQMIGHTVEWRLLGAFLPPQLRTGVLGRSALAATFVASLELAKTGEIELRQEEIYGPIFVRGARPSP